MDDNQNLDLDKPTLYTPACWHLVAAGEDGSRQSHRQDLQLPPPHLFSPVEKGRVVEPEWATYIALLFFSLDMNIKFFS
jgi:hypothetical protein